MQHENERADFGQKNPQELSKVFAEKIVKDHPDIFSIVKEEE